MEDIYGPIRIELEGFEDTVNFGVLWMLALKISRRNERKKWRKRTFLYSEASLSSASRAASSSFSSSFFSSFTVSAILSSWVGNADS